MSDMRRVICGTPNLRLGDCKRIQCAGLRLRASRDPAQLQYCSVSYVFHLLRVAALCAMCTVPGAISAQSPAPAQGSPPAQPAQTVAPQPADSQVLAAESAIASNDMKTAQSSLESYVAAHPGDERALFDLGYIADAQNRLDDAADLYAK